MGEKETGVAAVERALSILEAFRDAEPPLTLHELAGRTGLYKSTLLRLLASLERRHCILRIEGGRYLLGPALLHWGNIYQRSLRLEDHVLPVLRQLSERSGESASFFIRQGEHRLCLFRVDSARAVRDHVRPGDLLPLERGAGGRVLIAYADPERMRDQAVATIATFGERDPDTAAVAAPVFGSFGSLAGALSVSGPRMRFTTELVNEIAAMLLQAAIDLTTRLGGDAGGLARFADARPAKRSTRKTAVSTEASR